MAIIELEIVVQENIDNLVRLYDRLQIFRSIDEDGDPNPYVAITLTEPTHAIIDGSIAGSWNLNGTSLNVVIDGADPIVVTFTGSNPFLPQTVRDRINTVFPGLASETPTNTDRLRLTSPSEGTQSILEIGGTAASVLGLSLTRTNGKGASPLLSANTEVYRILDFDGLPTYWYKARYVNSVSGAASAFSDPFLGGNGTGLPSPFTVLGSIAISDVSGAPLVGRRIIFVSTGSQIVNDGSGHNYGILPSVDRLTVITDGNGRASMSLVKGQRLKVFIEGTSFQREFVVPTTDFDILTVSSIQPDPLSIVTVPPFPIRVS